MNTYIYLFTVQALFKQLDHMILRHPPCISFYRSSKNAGFNQQNRSRDNPFRLDIYVMYLKRGFP